MYVGREPASIGHPLRNSRLQYHPIIESVQQCPFPSNVTVFKMAGMAEDPGSCESYLFDMPLYRPRATWFMKRPYIVT